MPAAGLIKKDLEICRILTGQISLLFLKLLAQGNIEQTLIQFLVLLYIMDKSGHYQYVFFVSIMMYKNVSNTQSKPCHFEFQMPINKPIAHLKMGMPFLPLTNN